MYVGMQVWNKKKRKVIHLLFKTIQLVSFSCG